VQELEKAKICAVSAKDMPELKKCHFQRKAGLKDLKAKIHSKYGNKPQKETIPKQNDALDDEFVD